MNIQAAEAELAEFLVRLETATWNRPRTSYELQSFISSRHANDEDGELFNVSLA